MSDRAVSAIAEQLATNLFNRLTNGPRWGTVDDFKAVLNEEARSILAAIKAARIAVVELPEPWTDEHSAKGEPVGRVIYDADDDLFTVKVANGKWVAYYSQGHLYSLTNADIDGDRWDQIVGVIEVRS
ncbi:hypothetical protein [Mycobacterium sp. DL99]|uniref:hypothetical protein n=1 Tax=Mycobacterium sp. DL99 TaxID=2528957 RepID=UPI0010806FA8|nr:hypothetical protein [Mycobacterium sp. DL99]